MILTRSQSNNHHPPRYGAGEGRNTVKDRDTPLRLVRKWEKMEPGIYGILDDLRAAKDCGEMDWPDYCELPISAAYTYLADRYDDRTAAGLCAELTALWTWRRTKIVYSFDPDLAASLAAQTEDVQDTDVLPCDLLLHLPYPCIYIKARDILEHTDGFFTYIEYDTNHDRPELRIQWMLEDMQYTFPQVLHLLPGKTIKECILDTIRTTQENLEEDINLQDVDVGVARSVLAAIQLVLYIVSANAEIDPVPAPVTAAATAGKVTTLGTPKEDKASQVRELAVGVRVGAALRKARRVSGGGKSAGAGGTKRSHTRRGHWHHYWVGPMQGERRLTLKWTAPTIIHPEDVEDNVVIYPVRNNRGGTNNADRTD